MCCTPHSDHNMIGCRTCAARTARALSYARQENVVLSYDCIWAVWSWLLALTSIVIDNGPLSVFTFLLFPSYVCFFSSLCIEFNAMGGEPHHNPTPDPSYQSQWGRAANTHDIRCRNRKKGYRVAVCAAVG